MAEYECGECEGLGEKYYGGSEQVSVCVNCNGTGYTNRCWEGD